MQTDSVRAIPEFKRRYQHYINGRFEDSANGAVYTSISAATEEVLYEAAAGDAEDVGRAVTAARRAFLDGAWRRTTATQRGRALSRLADLIAQHVDHLTPIECADSGRVIKEMAPQVESVPEYLYYYGGLADKVEGSVIPGFVTGRLTYSLREPIGVVGAIVPWNAPLGLAVLKLAPALAAGNTVVLKPSEHTAASILEVARFVGDCGIPDGVLNIVTGGPDVGAALAAHPSVGKLSFTGGTSTGREVASVAGHRLVGTVLELGGKSPQVVFSDADLDLTIPGLVAGVFAAAGQSCVAGSRILVCRSILDEVVDRVVDGARRLRIGEPLDTSSDVGPLCFSRHRERVEQFVEGAVNNGATVVTGGARPSNLRRGYYYEPTVLVGASHDSCVAQEEIFGPVVTVHPWTDEAEAVRLANDTRYGLAAGVWTTDLSTAHRVAAAMETGTVWVNLYRGYTPLTPMGGLKDSGLGKEGGIEGIGEFQRTKVISMHVPEQA